MEKQWHRYLINYGELNNYVKNPHESHKKWNLIFEQED